MKNSPPKKTFKHFLALALLLVGVISFTPEKVKIANALNNDEKILYYFSDAAHCAQYRTEILNATDVDVCYLYDWHDVDPEYFNTLFINYCNSELYTEITNAYVILEITYGYEGLTRSQVFQKLKPFFRTLKNNGCKTTFIYGTDESLFLGANGFLDYVDIHINTSSFDIFMLNIFYQYHCDNDYEMPLENCTFIIDRSLANDIPNIDTGYTNNFLNYWFVSYLDYYRDYYIENNDWDETSLEDLTYFDICCAYNIRIVLEIAEGIFYDVFTNDQFYVYYDTEKTALFEYVDSEHIYSIGTTWIGQTYSAWWMDLMTEARGHLNVNFPIYICNTNNYEYNCYDEPNLYMLNSIMDYYEIIERFVLDLDLSCYNNWVGRCEVTHKSISQSPSRWVYAFYGNGGTFNISICSIGEEESADDSD